MVRRELCHLSSRQNGKINLKLLQKKKLEILKQRSLSFVNQSQN